MGAWGKRQREGGEDACELSLLGHCADVAAVTEALLGVETIRRRMQRLAGRALSSADIARLACLALWHDLGKANVGFWSQRFGDAEGARMRRAAGLDESDRGHTAVAATLLSHDKTRGRFCEAFSLETLKSWGEAALPLLWAAISHHGTPLYCAGGGTEMVGMEGRCAELANAWVRFGDYDPMQEIAELAGAARRWFPEAFEGGTDPLPDAPAFMHGFAGLVSLADWIGSNAENGFFPYAGDGGEDRMRFARPRARDVLARMCIDVERAREALRARDPPFESVFPFAPSQAQAAMARTDLGPVVVLESETGSGKTEAALWRFKTLFAAGEVDSLSFLLPTRVAATALKGRVQKFLRDLFASNEPPLNCVLGVPGYTYADGVDATGKLANFETLWPDSDDENAAHRRWASEHPKRCFAAAVTIGTVDQALLSALRARHAHLRGAALLRSLLVIDEVHASDAYMTGLLQEALDRHVRAGGHALLLSATLGGAARERLVKAGQAKWRAKPGSAAPPAVDHAATPYPLVSDCTGARAAPAPGKKRIVRFDLRAEIGIADAIASAAAEAARRGARVLIVRNTVGTAMQVQEALEAALADAPHLLFTVNGRVAMHHGRYAAEDRKVLDAAIEDELGKDAQRPHGLVVVGTQTLEQSLDIDADLLITDLAPADVLLQRFGRLHRHERERPQGFGQARAIVLTPEGGLDPFLVRQGGLPSHGFGTTYTNLPSLRATLEELCARKIVTIPTDCRALVEAAVDRERLKTLCDCWGGSWPNAWQGAVGEDVAMVGQAHHARLDWNEDWRQQAAFPRRGEEKLKTRLGGDDRLVALPEPWTSPFGAELRQMKLPDWMLRGVPAGALNCDDPVEMLRTSNGHLLFRWCGISFFYDRLGLRVADGEGQSAS